MKFNKKGYLLLFVSLLCVSKFCVASAAEFSDIEVKNDILNGKITVSGKVDDVYSLSFCVTNDDIADFSYTENVMENKTYAIGQTVSESDGTFSCDMKMPAKLATDTYRVFVYADDGDGVYTDFKYSQQTTANTAFSILNTQNNISPNTEDIEVYIDVLDFDTDLYDKNGFDKEKLWKMFLESRPSGGFSDISDMQYTFNVLCLSIEMSNNNDLYANDKTLSEKGELYGDINAYTNSSEKARLAVCTILQNKFLSDSKFSDFVEHESVLQSFKNAEVWNEYPDLIEKFPKYFQLTTALEEKLSKLTATNKNQVYMDMYTKKNNYQDCESVFDTYKKLIVEKYNKQTSDENKDSSGAAGGGTGTNTGYAGGGSNIGPIGVPETDNNTSEKEIFSDINEALWAKEFILDLYNKNIVSGSTDGKFYPNSNIKREEFVKMIVLSFKLENKAEIPFTDVGYDAWCRDYIALGYGEKIINGISEGEFGVGKPLTRQDLAVIVYRAMKQKGIYGTSGELKFTDSDDIAEYAQEAVYTISEMKIINGMPDGTFRPYEYATRAQTAKILSMVLDVINK